MVSSYYQDQKTEDLGTGRVGMYMETPAAYGPTVSDAYSVGALHFQLVLVVLVSTCSAASPLVLDVGPLASRGSRITVSLRFADTEGASVTLTLARRARVRVCAQMLERTGPGAAVPEIPESPGTRMGGHSVEGRTGLPDALPGRGKPPVMHCVWELR